MDDTTTFADMARELGLPKKLLYSVKEVSKVLGVPCSLLHRLRRDEVWPPEIPPAARAQVRAACETRMGGRLDSGRYT